MENPKVLWVDDDIGLSLELLARYLSRSGIDLDTAPDVDTALHRLEKEHYDAILLDMVLPSRHLAPYGGLDIAHEIRRQENRDPSRKPARIVFLTVMDEDELAGETKKLGAQFFDKLDLLNEGQMELLIDTLKGRTPI